MPFDEVTLTEDIKTVLKTLASNTDPKANPDTQINFLAAGIAAAVKKAVTNSTVSVTVPTGAIVVMTAGSAASQTGANTSPVSLTGNIE